MANVGVRSAVGIYIGQLHASTCDSLEDLLRDFSHVYIGIRMDNPLYAGHGNSAC